jgi:hypothetical protein
VSRLIALMMEAAKTSETLVNFYQTTRRYNLEDSHLRTHRSDNLKSYYFCAISELKNHHFLKCIYSGYLVSEMSNDTQRKDNLSTHC